LKFVQYLQGFIWVMSLMMGPMASPDTALMRPCLNLSKEKIFKIIKKIGRNEV